MIGTPANVNAQVTTTPTSNVLEKRRIYYMRNGNIIQIQDITFVSEFAHEDHHITCNGGSARVVIAEGTWSHIEISYP